MDNTSLSTSNETTTKAKAVLADSFYTTIHPDNLNETNKPLFTDIQNSFRIMSNSIVFSLSEGKSSPNLNSKLQKRNIHIYNKCFQCIKNLPYDISNQTKVKLQSKLNKIIYFCYRKNFLPIYSNKSNKTIYTSDSGWGCMIRCSQMIVSRALYKIFKHQGTSKKTALYNSIVYFLEHPFQLAMIPDVFLPILNNYLKQIYLNNNNISINIKSMLPPFSIKNLCSIGEIFHKTAGEWFSDINLAQIYGIINNNFKCFDDIVFLPFLSTIVKEKIINECFIVNPPIDNTKEVITLQDGRNVYFNKAGIIFVSVRLGIDSIVEEYYDNIKEMFNCKQCVGIIGGRKALAYYFIGYDSKFLYYLDPHITKETVKHERKASQLLKHYLEKDIHWMTLNELQPAFTVGFVFRNGKEYLELIEWMEGIAKKTYAVLGITDKLKQGGEMSKEEIMKKYCCDDSDDF